MSRRNPVLAYKGEQILRDPSLFGVKAAGLTSVPGAWTPSFFSLRVGIAQTLHTEPHLRDSLTAAIARLRPCPEGLIVRSSASTEHIEHRGAYDSLRCAATAEDVALQIDVISERAPADVRDKLGFVVHSCIPAAAAGHLSNERRVSRDARGWLWEVEIELLASTSERFRVDSNVPDRPNLTCSSLEEVPAALRAVAREMTSPPVRFHLEWIWDGTRVWIVQSDAEHPARGHPPGYQWTRPPATPLSKPLRLFKNATYADQGFSKARHVRTFRDTGLPHGDVRVLSGSRVVSGLAQDKISRDLERDLTHLIEAPVVVRTDFRGSSTQPVVLSKRTDTCLTYDELTKFLLDTSKALIDDGTSPGDIAFLVHRFVLAQAGAFGFARPGTSSVRVDATWGIPDSLLFHSHDSFRVDIDTGKVEQYLRCKTDYIDVDATGRWRSRPAGTPWDWQPSLTERIAREIATMCAQIADHVGFSVEVMFFISEGVDATSILPWFYTKSNLALADVHAASGYYVGERVTIRDDEDLKRLDERLTARPSRLSLSLRPTFDLLRSKRFIDAVAESAKHWHTPIELEGSQLSHIYYLLEEAGAPVRCLDPWVRPERRQPFGKLVRDLVPVRIERHGEQATVYSAQREELGPLIRAKIIEEAVEYFWARGASSAIEELADLYELLLAASTVLDVDFSAVEETARRKKAERGGFEGGVVLVETKEGLDGPRDGLERFADPKTRGQSTQRSRRRGLTQRRVVRLPGRRLLLPVAPPTGWEMNEPRVVALNSDEEAAITYGATTIQVQVRPRHKGPGRDQLPLFEPSPPQD